MRALLFISYYQFSRFLFSPTSEIVAARDDAVQFLKSHVMGDVLAAEYLLAHLLSKMYVVSIDPFSAQSIKL